MAHMFLFLHTPLSPTSPRHASCISFISDQSLPIPFYLLNLKQVLLSLLCCPEQHVVGAHPRRAQQQPAELFCPGPQRIQWQPASWSVLPAAAQRHQPKRQQVRAHTHTHAHARTHAHTHTRTRAYAHTRTRTHTRAHTHAHASVHRLHAELWYPAIMINV